MVNQRQKEQKKKNRERAARTKVLAKREAIRKERKSISLEKEKEKEAHEIVYGKLKPFIKDPEVSAQREALNVQKVSEKLAQNLKILEALEQEYEAEQAVRSEMNTKLEEEGYSTIREKMDALHKKALAMTGKAEELADAEKEFAENNSN